MSEKEELDAVVGPFPTSRRHLLAILQAIQESRGYLSEEAMIAAADHVGVSVAEVYGVATFYNQFRFIPYGAQHVVVCLGTACHAMGGRLILDAFERELDIDAGGITEDHEWSLDRVGCIGCCTKAPVVVVNKEIHAKMRPFRVEELLATFGWQKNQRVDEDEGGGGPGTDGEHAD